MKITYEVGDNVELEDNTEVPHELGACFVELKEKRGNKWVVTIIEDYGCESPRPDTLIVDEKWFSPA